MEAKEFKYQSCLDKYPECPMKECVERNTLAFRWVHLEIEANDFKINIDHPKYDRTLDDKDLKCEDFALSLYKDFGSSKASFLHQYNVNMKTEIKKQKFLSRKGNAAALLQLTEKDGVCDEPDKDGHFSFFPYLNFDYSECVKNVISIFVNDDKD